MKTVFGGFGPRSQYMTNVEMEYSIEKSRDKKRKLKRRESNKNRKINQKKLKAGLAH